MPQDYKKIQQKDLLPMQVKPCKWCKNPEPRHHPFQCFKNPKYGKYKPPKATRKSLAMQDARRVWFQENPPNDEGYYVCYLCGRWLIPAETTLDHVVPRSHAPELRLEPSNLAPCCYVCNSKKGSKSLEKYLLEKQKGIDFA